jgi:hypothetical protein
MRRLGRQLLVTSSMLCFTACGGGAESGAAGAPPARSGEVWGVRNPDDRAAVAGSIVAFVNGVHVMVVDGNQIYAGMTELTTKDGAGGARTIVQATLARSRSRAAFPPISLPPVRVRSCAFRRVSGSR